MKLLKICFLFLLFASAACTPLAAPASAPAAGTPGDEAGQPAELVVMAAASLTDAFSEIGQQFEQQHPGVTITFNFAASQQLAQQLANGAPADVFASANQKQMDAAAESGRVAVDSAQVFVTNRLVVVIPQDNPGRVAGLPGLAKSGLKLVLAAGEVPVGQYSLDFLEKASQDGEFGPQYKENVLDNVVSYEETVRVVLTKVALGEADAGIVYTSDITADAAGQVKQIDIPDELNVLAAYPIAAVQDSQHAGLAQAFVDYVLSEDGQATLQKYGFLPAAGSNP